MSALTSYDAYLAESGPAALVLREQLTPVEGSEAVLFPPTFAKGEGFEGGYNIDGAADGENVCLVDSVGSQANRIEPMFARTPYDALVPQVTVRAGERAIKLLDAGHRAGDALVRCSSLQEALQLAFKALQKGDASPMAKLAPTSLVFGVWDSRDTQAKAPRLVSSTVRAFNVRKLRRSAQYVPALDYVAEGALDEPVDKVSKDSYAERGFIHVPATGTPGGVIARGGIRRDATLSLAALRLLASNDEESTRALQRYVLALSLVALTAPMTTYLRQGCNLVLDTGSPSPRTLLEVYASGERRQFGATHADVLAFALLAAKDFGVGESHNVAFERERAKRDLADGGAKKQAKKAAKRA